MQLVAVTACPTGIAHSQMAAENLEQTAEALDHDIAVEVQGAMGTENELTADQIDAADAVIVAADTSVTLDRFEGKPVVKDTVKGAVNDAEALINEAVTRAEAGKTGVENASGDDDGDNSSARQPRQTGGDRSKSLLNRLKRLFS